MTTINEALDYIYSFANLERGVRSKSLISGHYNLDNILKILEIFQNPQNGILAFHIAGTKGKGSVTALITSLLVSSGYSVVTFSSPHLIATNERIQYSLSNISDSDLIRITHYIKTKLAEAQLTPTTFELFFIIYLLYGKEKNPDYYVIETGLGGRLDCTNVVTPLVSVITSIGLEHTEILGKTIQAISFEKAGIIKKDVPVVIGRQKYSCQNFFRKKAQDLHSPYYYAPQNYTGVKSKDTSFGIHISCTEKNSRKKIETTLSLHGTHQLDNFLTALKAVTCVLPDLIVSEQIHTSLRGRVEIVDQYIPLVADVSHTEESVKVLGKVLRTKFGKRKWHVLLGLASDKKYKKIIGELSKIAESFIITTLDEFKFSDPETVYMYAKKKCKNSHLITDRNEAFRVFIEKNESLLITGSFYLTGPFLDYYNVLNQQKR